MRIVHVANIEEQLPEKKTKKQLQLERCLLMVKNQRYEDRKQATAMFADRIKRLKLMQSKITTKYNHNGNS